LQKNLYNFVSLVQIQRSTAKIDAPAQFTCYFWVLLTFLGIVKITINELYCFILEWRLVDPLAKLALLAQTSSYVTGHVTRQATGAGINAQAPRDNLIANW